MNWKAALFAVVVLILLLVVMFYSGMFMHGDPIEPPRAVTALPITVTNYGANYGANYGDSSLNYGELR